MNKPLDESWTIKPLKLYRTESTREGSLGKGAGHVLGATTQFETQFPNQVSRSAFGRCQQYFSESPQLLPSETATHKRLNTELFHSAQLTMFTTSRPLLITGLISLLLLLPLLATAAPMFLDELDQQVVWGPTSVFYWRCRTPLVVEMSWDLDHWVPSSVCLEGTCCSPLAEGPLCSKEACSLVGNQTDRPTGQDPIAVSGGNVPKRPSMGVLEGKERK